MKTQSLADVLGLQYPANVDKPVVTETAPAKLSAEDFCKTVLNSSEFRVFILNGLVAGDIPPQILVRIMDQGWGKPVARIEVKDTTAVDDMNVEQLEHRATALAKIARAIKQKKSEIEKPEVEVDVEAEKGSIH